MSFLSNVFSKFTGVNRDDIDARPEHTNLECQGETDDFVLFSKKEDSNDSKPFNSAPPMYNQVVSERQSESQPMGYEEYMASMKTNYLVISPIDGVPFELWNAEFAMFESSPCGRETRELLLQSKRLSQSDLISRCNYSFQTELSVLKELGHDLDSRHPHSLPSDRSLIDFNDIMDNSSRSQPITGHLIDLT